MFSTIKKFFKKEATKKSKTNLNNSKSKLVVRPHLGDHYEYKADLMHLSHLSLSSNTINIFIKSDIYYLSNILQFLSLDSIRASYIKAYPINKLIERLNKIGLDLKSNLWYNQTILYEKTVFVHLIDDWAIYDEYHKSIILIGLLNFTIRRHNCLKRAIKIHTQFR